MEIQIKRVYDPAEPGDGFRVLVDRVWPRGMTKKQVQADLWLKEAAPSTDLRKWYNHEPEKWEEFKHRYFLELDGKPDPISMLREKAAEKRLTLLFSARDEDHSQAAALKEYLLSRKEGD